ncbi:hypothetical protein PR003_g9516, partial [Phytophthora rubi]
MLFASGLPLYFWGDAVEYAAFVLNRSSCSANPKRMSPLEMLTGEVPNLSDIVTFGSPCTAYIDPGKKAWKSRAQHIKNVETLDSKQNAQLQAQLEREDHELKRAVEEREQATERKEHVADSSQISETPKVPESGDPAVKSKKKRPRKKSKKSSKKKRTVTAEDAAEVEGAGADEEQLPAEEVQPTRMRTRYMGKKHVSVGSVSAVMLKDPKNFREVMRDPRAEKWKQDIREEIEALEQNGTWKVVKKLENAKLLHTKWVFKLKTHADGTIERYKARLVARGDEQEYGIDYTYTFSAVLDMESGKIILVVSRIWKVPARHGDVPSAYVKAKKEA